MTLAAALRSGGVVTQCIVNGTRNKYIACSWTVLELRKGFRSDEPIADDFRLCGPMSLAVCVCRQCAAVCNAIRTQRIRCWTSRLHQGSRSHQESFGRGPAGDRPAPDIQVFLALCASEQRYGERKEQYGQGGFLLGLYK